MRNPWKDKGIIMAGVIDTIKNSYKQFKEASTKTIPEYEKEAEAKKAEKEYDKAGGPLVKKPKGMKKGGVTRADGCAQRGKTRGKMV